MRVISSAQYLVGSARGDIHHHNEYEIIYIAEGTLEIEISGKEYTATSGSIILITNLENHVIHCASSDYKRYCITLNPAALDSYIQSPGIINMLKNHNAEFVHCIDMTSVREQTETLIRKCLDIEQDEVYFNELAACYITELMICIYNINPGNFTSGEHTCHKTVLDIQKYIDKNFAEEIRIAEISKKFCISSFYLTHKFKEITGFSPKQYLTSVRLKNAEHLIHHTDRSINEIAADCGFADAGGFIRSFKKHYGYSPGNARSNKKF